MHELNDHDNDDDENNQTTGYGIQCNASILLIQLSIVVVCVANKAPIIIMFVCLLDSVHFHFKKKKTFQKFQHQQQIISFIHFLIVFSD